MNNRTICIDLTNFNNEAIVKISAEYSIESACLLDNKKMGVGRIWIDLDLGVIVSFSLKGKTNIVFTDEYLDMMKNSLNSIKPIEIKKDYSVDTILDKISKYGISSLTLNEKTFLESQ